MRTLDLTKAIELFTSVMHEKRQMADKERQAVENLNRALKRTGYQIIHAKAEAMGKRRGRPRGVRNKFIKHDLHKGGHNGVGKRGPGRPRLKPVA
jgi:hypothetical protein